MEHYNVVINMSLSQQSIDTFCGGELSRWYTDVLNQDADGGDLTTTKHIPHKVFNVIQIQRVKVRRISLKLSNFSKRVHHVFKTSQIFQIFSAVT